MIRFISCNIKRSFVVLILILPTLPCLAAPTDWTNVGTGNWEDATNWSAGVPDAVTDTIINNGGTAEIDNSISVADKDGAIIKVGDDMDGNIDQSAGTLNANRWIVIGEQEGSNGRYNLSGGELNSFKGDPDASGAINVGNLGNGQLNVGADGMVSSDGNIIVGVEGGTGVVTTSGAIKGGSEIIVGLNGSGTLNIEGGTVRASTILKVGENGIGIVNQSAGFVNPEWVVIGSDSSSDGEGTYNISGGDLRARGNIEVGKHGLGSIIQTGGEVHAPNSLRFGETSSGDGAYEISDGMVSTGIHINIAQEGSGLFQQSGGTVNAGAWVELGSASGSVGSYAISGGTLNALGTHSANDGDIIVGRLGEGNLLIEANGTVNANNNVILAIENAGQGTLDTSGSLTVQSELIVGLAGEASMEITGGQVITFGPLKAGHGNGSDGTINQSAGNVSPAWLSVGAVEPGANGTYNLSDGVINSAGTVEIGTDASGRFLQTGGTVNIGSRLRIADRSGEGKYNLGDGEVNVQSEWIEVGGESAADGHDGSGTFNISGGTLRINRGDVDDDGHGDFNVGRAGTGLVTQTGGTVSVGEDLTLAADGGTGTYNLNGGVLNFDGGTIDINTAAGGTAQFNFTGGVLKQPSLITNTLTQDGGIFQPAATTAIFGDYEQNAGTLLMAMGGTNEGEYASLVVESASLSEKLAIQTADGYDPVIGDTVTLISASSRITGQFASIDGVPIDTQRAYAVVYGNGEVVLRVTRPGNTDLDNDVDFQDFVTVSNNFNKSGVTWSGGDFTGDGDVGFNDFVLLSTNFGVVPANISVPEPSSIVLVMLAFFALGTMRRLLT